MLLFLILLVILTEALTQLVVKASIFENLRNFLSLKSKFLTELLSCGYCFSFWASLFFNLIFFLSDMPLLKFDFGILSWLLNLLFSVILVQRLSNYLHGVSDRFFDTAKDVRYTNFQNSLEELQDE
jgi:hypothetical protein